MQIVSAFLSASFVVALLLLTGPVLFLVAVGLSLALYVLLLKSVFGTLYHYVRSALNRRFDREVQVPTAADSE